MDADKKLLLQRKLEANKRKLEEKKILIKKSKIDNQMKDIINNVDNFDKKYRFANDAENQKIENLINKLNFASPAHIAINENTPTPHCNMYLCFLCGGEELLDIYIYGKYEDLMEDIDNWDYFSPYLLLIDEDFNRYIYINDYGEQKESKID